MSPMDRTVLVVEDNDLNMRLFHDVLEARGYNVLQAKDGMEGWRIARKHRPDLIIMDIQLPEVSGLEVTKWLKDDETLKRGRGQRPQHEAVSRRARSARLQRSAS